MDIKEGMFQAVKSDENPSPAIERIKLMFLSETEHGDLRELIHVPKYLKRKPKKYENTFVEVQPASEHFKNSSARRLEKISEIQTTRSKSNTHEVLNPNIGANSEYKAYAPKKIKLTTTFDPILQKADIHGPENSKKKPERKENTSIERLRATENLKSPNVRSCERISYIKNHTPNSKNNTHEVLKYIFPANSENASSKPEERNVNLSFESMLQTSDPVLEKTIFKANEKSATESYKSLHNFSTKEPSIKLISSSKKKPERSENTSIERLRATENLKSPNVRSCEKISYIKHHTPGSKNNIHEVLKGNFQANSEYTSSKPEERTVNLSLENMLQTTDLVLEKRIIKANRKSATESCKSLLNFGTKEPPIKLISSSRCSMYKDSSMEKSFGVHTSHISEISPLKWKETCDSEVCQAEDTHIHKNSPIIINITDTDSATWYDSINYSRPKICEKVLYKERQIKFSGIEDPYHVPKRTKLSEPESNVSPVTPTCRKPLRPKNSLTKTKSSHKMLSDAKNSSSKGKHKKADVAPLMAKAKKTLNKLFMQQK